MLDSQTPDKLNEELRRRLHEVIDEFTEPNKGERYISELEDSILQLFTTAYAEAIRGAVPQWADEAYYTKHPVTWKPIAPESNAEHYDAGFNQAIDTFTTNLKNQGLLPNGKENL